MRKVRRSAGVAIAIAFWCAAWVCGMGCGSDEPSDSSNSSPSMDTGMFDAGVSDMSSANDATTEPDEGTMADMVEVPDTASDMSERPDMDMGEVLPPVIDTAAQSGTRLKLRYIDAGGGAYQTLGLWDSELEIACAFEEAFDGTLRCLPREPSARRGSRFLFYADSSCTEQVFIENTDAPCGADYARSDVGEVFRRSEQPAVLEGGRVYSTTDLGCTVDSSMVEELGDVREAERVPSARFVAGTRTMESRSGGLAAQYIEGEDGSRVLEHVVQQSIGARCEFDDEGRCLPQVLEALQPHFADNGCSQPVAEIREADDIDVGVFYTETADATGCQTDREYYRLGTEVDGNTLYRINDEGECIRDLKRQNRRYFRYGSSISIESLGSAELRREGNGPIVAQRWVDDMDRPLSLVEGFWNTEFDEICVASAVADQTVYCVPETQIGTVRAGHFAEDGCSDDARAAQAFCLDEEPRLLVEFASNLCSDPGLELLSAVYTPGDEISDFYYFQNRSVMCEERMIEPNARYFEVGSVATSNLPRLEFGIEDN